MTEATRAAVRRMHDSHKTATLATTGEGGSWAATVFFASDAELNLYFVSDRRTRHGRDLAAHREVAVAIHADCQGWSAIRGLQIAGRAGVADGRQRALGLAHYLAKCPDIKALLEMPRSAEEQTIAERLKAASLCCLTPRWVRLIDNMAP